MTVSVREGAAEQHCRFDGTPPVKAQATSAEADAI